MPDIHALHETPDEIEGAAFAKLLSEVHLIHENATRNLGALINGDPSKEYVWVRNANDTIAQRQGMGYEIVRQAKQNKKPSIVREIWRRDDGSFVRGDLILMSMDKERHRALKLYSELKAVQNLRNSRTPILQAARQAGIRANLAPEDGASYSNGEQNGNS